MSINEQPQRAFFEIQSDSLLSVCEQYQLGEVRSAPVSLGGGMLHDVWQLSTAAGEFALKKVNVGNWALLKHTIATVDFFETLAEHQQRHGVLTRVARASITGQRIVDCPQGFRWMVSPWINGRICEPLAVTVSDAQTVGQVLKKIQQAAPTPSGLSLPHWFGFSTSHWLDLIAQGDAQNLAWAGRLRQALALLIEWSSAAAAAAPTLQNKLIVSHRDLSPSNILWGSDNRPVVIDWEYAGLVNPESELFNTAMTWSYCGEARFDTALFEAFVAGADTRFTLPRQVLLTGFAGYLLEWCEFNLQRSLQQSVARELAENEVNSVISILEQLV